MGEKKDIFKVIGGVSKVQNIVTKQSHLKVPLPDFFNVAFNHISWSFSTNGTGLRLHPHFEKHLLLLVFFVTKYGCSPSVVTSPKCLSFKHGWLYVGDKTVGLEFSFH